MGVKLQLVVRNRSEEMEVHVDRSENSADVGPLEV